MTIPNSVTTIGISAFNGCSSLTSVTIGDKVESIGGQAFAFCSKLTSVTIGNSVTTIGDWAFGFCDNLTTVNYKGTEEQWNEITGIDQFGNVTTINYYSFKVTASEVSDTISGLGEGSYTIIVTGTITNAIISDIKGALQNNSNAMVNLDLSETTGLESIGNNAFRDCSKLTSVTIPDSVISISSAFFGCSSLTRFIVSTNNANFSTSDDGKILYNKEKTALIAYPSATGDVTIGDNVTYIGAMAFQGCGSLTSVTIGNNVTSIGGSAFEYCSSLTSVTIGDNVTSIGNFAFNGCSSLTSVTIPDNVTSIGTQAFFSCTGLTSVTIGNNVTTIGDGAFFDCKKLTTVNYKGTEEQWNEITGINFENVTINYNYTGE